MMISETKRHREADAALCMPVRERNHGIELLRILSMVFVVTLHVLGQGGIYPYAGTASNLAEHPWNYRIAWILETAAYGAVDLFALISGFVALRSRWASKRYLRLWALVAFWGVAMVFLINNGKALVDGVNNAFANLIPCIRTEFEVYDFSGTEYRDAVLNVSAKQYWYFNMYTLLFLFIPVLNAAISKLGKKRLTLITFGLFLLTSVYRTISEKDLFVMGGGYSAMWLMIMYLTGAAVRLHYDDGFRPPKWMCGVGYMLCTAISVGWRFYMDSMIKRYPGNETYTSQRGLLISYTAPFIVIGSVLLLLLFMQLRVRSKAAKRIIAIASDASFAVYIIHVQPVFWQYYMKDRFCRIAYEPTLHMVLYTFTAIAVIYTACTVLELARKALFRLTRLSKLIDFLGDETDSFIANTFLKGKT